MTHSVSRSNSLEITTSGGGTHYYNFGGIYQSNSTADKCCMETSFEKISSTISHTRVYFVFYLSAYPYLHDM